MEMSRLLIVRLFVKIILQDIGDKGINSISFFHNITEPNHLVTLHIHRLLLFFFLSLSDYIITTGRKQNKHVNAISSAITSFGSKLEK